MTVEKNSGVDAQLLDQVMNIVARETGIDPNSITMEMRLDTLDIASTDIVMALMAIEEELNVYVPVDGDIAEAETVGDLVHFLAEQAVQNA